MISVTIPVVHAQMIEAVLASLDSSKGPAPEIIINDSGSQPAPGLARASRGRENVRVIRAVTGRLQSRLLMAQAARGEHVLMLDETRTVSPDLLLRLAESGADLAFVGEEELGSTPWARWAQLDRVGLRSVPVSELAPDRQLYAIPRYYSRELYLTACARAAARLGAARISRVSTADIEIPFIESYALATAVRVLPDPLIFHTPDRDLSSLLRKYYAYGRGARLLEGTPYSFVSRVRSHRRRLEALSFRDRARVQMLLGIRGASFLVGYHLERGESSIRSAEGPSPI